MLLGGSSKVPFIGKKNDFRFVSKDMDNQRQ